MINKLRPHLRGLWLRRYYLWSRVIRLRVPVHTLSWLPDGLCVRPVRGTDISVVDGFCSASDADALRRGESEVLPALNARAAMFAGVSAGNRSELVVRTINAARGVIADDSHSVALCVFLESGSLQLRLPDATGLIQVESRAGRAVSWVIDSNQAAATWLLADDQETATVLLFLHSAERSRQRPPLPEVRQCKTGVPLTGEENLPEGVWAPGQDHLEAVFGKPDLLTDLVK